MSCKCGGSHEHHPLHRHIRPLLFERIHDTKLPQIRSQEGKGMKRFIQQYALLRKAFKNKSRALRNAIRDCGINPRRLSFSKTGTYKHSINNWNWRT